MPTTRTLRSRKVTFADLESLNDEEMEREMDKEESRGTRPTTAKYKDSLSKT